MEWKYKIHIKNQFEDETTPELVDKLCKSSSSQLKRIIKDLERLEDFDQALEDLTTIQDNFDFLSSLASGEIKETEWDNYSFDGDFKDMFNDYLGDLYDLGDSRIEIRSKTYKFIWID